MTTRQRTDFVDTSRYQDYRIDFAAAKKAGVKGQYHKATEGATYRDPDYASRRADAARSPRRSPSTCPPAGPLGSTLLR